MSDFKLGIGVVIKVDKDWRGVGLPQVAMHSQLPRFLVLHQLKFVVHFKEIDMARCIDREFVTSAKKSRILTNFPKLKKIRKNSYKNSLNARVGVAFQWNSLCYKI